MTPAAAAFAGFSPDAMACTGDAADDPVDRRTTHGTGGRGRRGRRAVHRLTHASDCSADDTHDDSLSLLLISKACHHVIAQTTRSRMKFA